MGSAGEAGTYRQLGPQDFYSVYNENPLLNGGITGAGQTIALIEQAEVAAADVAGFRAQFGLPAYPATPNAAQGGVNYLWGADSGLKGYASCLAPVSVGVGKASGEEAEADIDLQWSGVVAPRATIDFVACGRGDGSALGSLGIDRSAQYIVNYLYSTVTAASLSYGECEQDMSSASGYYSRQWQQFAAEGITAVVAAGDSASQQCYAGKDAGQVNGLGNSAYNVSAGGTDFGDLYMSADYTLSPADTWWNGTGGERLAHALSYIPESEWDGSCSSDLVASYLEKAGIPRMPLAICNSSASSAESAKGAMGGVSSSIGIPTWQSVHGVATSAGPGIHRNLPDVSLFAGSGLWGHFLPYCQADVAACDLSESGKATSLGSGGTAFVAPQVAGLLALIGQQTESRQGQADYTFYKLAAHEYGTQAVPNASRLAACSGSAQGAHIGGDCIFQDISDDMHSLQGGAVAGAAAPGYDNATGLGSVNIHNLVENWNLPARGYASTTSLMASSQKADSAGNVTLTATVTASGRGGTAAPAGMARFYLGSTAGTLLGSAPVVSICAPSGSRASCNGVAALTISGAALKQGDNQIVAWFEGDGAGDNPSTSASVHIDGSETQTIAFSTVSSVVYGAAPVNLSATASSGLPVTFSIVSGPATLVGYSMVFNAVGSVVVEADQAGNATYAAAPPVQQTITVTQAPLTIAVNNASGTYGSPLPTFTSVLTGLVNGDSSSDSKGKIRPQLGGGVDGTDLSVIYTTAASSTSPYSNADTYAITATLSGAAAGNYSITSNTPGTLTINPAPLTIVINNASETYGSPLPTFTSTLTGLVNGDTSSDVKGVIHRLLKGTVNGPPADITIVYSTTANSTSPYSGVGQYSITGTLSGSAAGNYTATSNTPGTLTIGAASLQVTATSYTVAQHDAFPSPLGFTITGFVNGDTQSVVGGAPSITTSATPTSAPGNYTIAAAAGSLTAANYNFTFVNGTLHIIADVPATLAAPAPSSTLGGPSATFSWAAAPGATGYQLWIGTTGINSNNIYSTGLTTATSVTPTNLPTTGGTLYVTLYTDFDSTYFHNYYTLTEATYTPAAITAPTPNSTLSGPSATFTWSPATNATAYQLWIGTTGVNSNNIYSTGAITATSVTPTNLPTTGGTLNVRLYYEVGGVYSHVDYTYTEATFAPAAITAPTPNSTLSGPSATFTWSPATNATAYQLWIGTTGVNSNNLYSSGAITATSVTPTNLPTTGGTLYVRLYYEVGGVYSHVDYTYTEATFAPAAITAPTPESTLSGPSATFTWSPATNATAYQLWIGTTGINSNNIYSTGAITGTSVTPTNLPTTGGILYVRLYYEVGGVYSHVDYTYTEATYTQAAITAPTPNSTLSGPSATFTWSPATNATAYQLWIGNTGVNSNNLYSSGAITATSVTPTNLPTTGGTLYVRLYYQVGGVYNHVDYTYTEATFAPAAITAPTPESTLSGPSATFTWSPATNATAYQLWIGNTGVNSNNLYSSGAITATTVNVHNLPTAGGTLYVRLYYQVGGVYNHVDYTYTEATFAPAAITAPTPESTLSGPSATFTWSPATNATAYQLWIGNTGVNSNNLYSSGAITATTVNVHNLPTAGGTLYVRLYYEVGGVYSHVDYTYTEAQ